jgi:hypothetical protein
LRAPRANHVFGTDEKRIRIENMVIEKSKGGLELLLSISATPVQERRNDAAASSA